MEGSRTIRRPMGWLARLALGVIPFAMVVGWYSHASWKGHVENPKYKILPNLQQYKEGLKQIFQERRHLRDGKQVAYTWFVVDTVASLRRLGLALLISVAGSLILGVSMGTFTHADAFASPCVRAVGKIPPMALLPLIFVLLGAMEDTPKIAIMVIGTMPILTQDVYLKVQEVPRESIQKAFTLGASTLEVTVRVIFAQAWPRILDGIRLMIGPLWALLIVSESIAATAGLGYRIYLQQRQINMNVIIPYVIWITLLAIAMDQSIKLWIRWRHPWALER